MRYLIAAAFLFAGCAPVATPLDAAMPADASPDAFAAIVECASLMDDPTCMGDCTVLGARCPPGYSPRCGQRTTRWMINSDGDCFVGGYGVQCDTATPTCHEGDPVCVPPGMGCSSPTGW